MAETCNWMNGFVFHDYDKIPIGYQRINSPMMVNPKAYQSLGRMFDTSGAKS